MPSPRELERSATVGRQCAPTPESGPSDALPPEYWQAVLKAAAADQSRPTSGDPARAATLSEIPDPILRVGCRRCGRLIEIQPADAIRLYGPEATWKEVGRRLLEKTCTQRTGRHEEEGCWPAFG